MCFLQLLHSLDEDDRSQGPVDSPTLSRAVKDVSHHISQVSVFGWVCIVMMKTASILMIWIQTRDLYVYNRDSIHVFGLWLYA